MLLCGLLPAGLGAQSTRSPADSVLVGTVRDAETMEPVGGALVRVVGEELAGRAFTDDGGVYRITIGRARPLHITVERLGYTTLEMYAARVEPKVRLDFLLTPQPIRLDPLTVSGGWTSRVLASLIEPRSAVSGASERVMETSVERSQVAPFAPLLQVVEATSRVGGTGSPPVSGGAIASLGVRGYLSRQGATYVDGAPSSLAAPVSFLADPFASSGPLYRLRVWDGGAPARVTGGVEYVAELDQRPRLSDPGSSWRANVDLVRSAAEVAWRGRSLAAEVSGYSTTPWASDAVGETGHRSRAVNAAAWAAPLPGQRLALTGSARRESLPAGTGSSAGTATLEEAHGSLRWDARIGSGLVDARAGFGRSRSLLPSAMSYPGQDAAFKVQEDRSSFGVEYRRPVARSVAVDVGADRLGFLWRASTSTSAAVWGLYGEAAWTPQPRVGVRVGARLDRDPSEGHLRLAPRARLEWRPRDHLELAFGSGVFHQLLLARGPIGSPVASTPLLATGVHHRVRASVDAGPLDLSVETYLKRLTGHGGTDGALHVWGVGFGVDAPVGRFAGLALAATLEQRREDGTTSWSPLVRLLLDRTIAAHTRLRVRIGASRSAGALVWGGTTADSLLVAGGGSLTDPDQDLRAWSVRSDLELSRRIQLSPSGRSLRVYVQVLNALGDEFRPLFLQNVEGGDPRVPRVLVLGVGMGSGGRGASRSGRLAR